MTMQQDAQPRSRMAQVMVAGALIIAAGIICYAVYKAMPWRNSGRTGRGPAGSVRLVYEVKSDATVPEAGLSERVLEVLRKRIDPDGIHNLAWQAHGNQIEIVVPLDARDRDARAAREAYLRSGQALEQMNIYPKEVDQAITTLNGDARREALEKLAQGSEQRGKLFAAMAAAHDEVQRAKTRGETMKQAEAEIRYYKLQEQITGTNIAASDLEAILEAKADVATANVEQVRQRFAGWQQRTDAINQFITANAAYRDTRRFDNVWQVKQLLRGMGMLSFHVLVEGPEMGSPEAMVMRYRLAPGDKGPAPQAGDVMRWLCAERPEDLAGAPMVDFDGKKWVLCWATPERSMENKPGELPWSLESAYLASTDMGTRALGFRLDANGGKRFAELTGGNLKRMMAAALDGRIINVATIQGMISREGIISRESGYTDAEFRYLMLTLNAGSLPAAISNEPIKEEVMGPEQDQAK